MKYPPAILDIMTSDPITINQDQNLSEVIKKMNEYKFNHLPVVDNQSRLMGIISESDLYKKALQLSKETTGESYSNKILYVTKASDVMTPNPVVVSSDHSLDFAIELLLQGQFHALPVVKDERILGIITSKDMLEYIADAKLIKKN